MQLTLAPHTLDVLGALLDASQGEFCAALLLGPNDLQQVVTVPNVAAAGDTFTITLSAWDVVERFANAQGSRVSALIHSHRATTTMSMRDRSEWARGGLPWIVVARFGGALAYAVYPPPRSVAVTKVGEPHVPSRGSPPVAIEKRCGRLVDRTV